MIQQWNIETVLISEKTVALFCLAGGRIKPLLI